MQLVSIIVCTYNGEKYIRTQLDSLINQTYKNIEILIIDDCSTDETLKIITEYTEKHNQITLHSFQKNVGYIKNFERGITLANGELIALCDQDDWWYDTKIEKLVKNIKQYDLIYCDSSFVDENLNCIDNSFSKIKNMVSGNNCVPFLIDNCVSGHAMLFRKELYLISLPFSKSIPHDWWLTFHASIRNGITYFNEPLVKYRHHQSNIIASSSKKEKRNKDTRLKERRSRINQFHNALPETHIKEKKIIKQLNESYKNFNLKNNLLRLKLFFSNQNDLLLISKKTYPSNFFYILSFFFKIK